MTKSEEYCGDFLRHLVQQFNGLLPLQNISSLTNISQVLEQPRRVTHKPIYILLLIIAMVTCVVMFSAQVWIIATRDWNIEGYLNEDPEDYFAVRWGTNMWGNVADRKLLILISTPITFLLCIILIQMLKNATVMRMLLFSLISLVIGMFFLVFSTYSVQCLIMMGVKAPLLFKLLTLVTLLPVPLLAAVFMALAYSTMIQVLEQKDFVSSNDLKTCYLSFSILLSIFFIFFSLATMTFSIHVVTADMQKEHWNSTRNYINDKECSDNGYRDHYSGDYNYNHRTTKTTTDIVDKPEKCYGKSLEYDDLQIMSFFSISQEFVTESVIFLGIFVILSGKKITKNSLIIPGIMLFVSPIFMSVAFFNVIDQEVNFPQVGETTSSGQEDIFFSQGDIFYMLNSINTLVPFIIGFICVLNGASVIISFFEFLFRTILSFLVFVCILLFTLLQVSLKLARSLATRRRPNHSSMMSHEEPEDKIA